MSTELENIWSQIDSQLSATVDEPVYRIWLQPLKAVDLSADTLTVAAPANTSQWVRERFGRVVQACVAATVGPHVTLEVIDAEDHPEARRSVATSATGSPAPTPHNSEEALGNPKLTFNQFVIGDCNRLAHAAALTVAELPSQAYNPLFICGPPGVGKTHLLRAIAAFIAAYNPALNIRSTTGESFTNDFVQALNNNRVGSFKASFRHVDVLLIDDVQFLERKTRTEEEFFHTFNALYEAGSQIVLTSDRPPSDLQALEDRLRERFQSGLVADVRAPDLQTRLAILRKRAQHDGVELDDRTLEVIAQRIATNVRSLEGALIRVVAFGSLTGRGLSSALATEVIDGLYPQTSKPLRCSITDVKMAACEQFGISTEELDSASRTSRLTWPRQVAMYLARELTNESLPSIGREFGGRDHSTVLNALKRAEQRITSNPASRTAVEQLRAKLAANRV